MKKLLASTIVFLLIVLLAVPVQAQPWNTNGVLTNPAANAILADSGPLTAGAHLINAFVASTAAAVVFVEWTDSSFVVIKSQAMFVSVNSNTPFSPSVQFNEIADGDHVRLRLNALVVGSMQGSVFIQ